MYKAEFSGKRIDDVEKELAKQGIIDVEIVKTILSATTDTIRNLS